MIRKLFFILFFVLSILSFAQSNPFYDINLKKGDSAYNNKRYSSAITFYSNALNSDGISSSQKKTIQNKIRLCRQKLSPPANVPSRTKPKKQQKKKENKDKILKLEKEIELAKKRDSILKANQKNIREENLRIALLGRYDLVDTFKEGFARVHKNMRYGFINNLGNEVIPLIYDFASDFSEGVASVKIANRYGFINKNGDIVIGFEFEYAGDFSEGYALIENKGKMGYINKNGTIVIEPIYSSANSFENGKAEVENNGIFFFINKQGLCVDGCDMSNTAKSGSINQDSNTKVIHTLSDSNEENSKYKDLLIENYSNSKKE